MQADMSHAFLFSPFFVFAGLISLIVAIIPYWFIFKKAGFSSWLSLLIVVPLVNLIVLYVVAFSRWKVVPATPVYLSPPGAGGIYQPPA
jgi:hypothetical protein